MPAVTIRLKTLVNNNEVRGYIKSDPLTRMYYEGYSPLDIYVSTPVFLKGTASFEAYNYAWSEYVMDQPPGTEIVELNIELTGVQPPTLGVLTVNATLRNTPANVTVTGAGPVQRFTPFTVQIAPGTYDLRAYNPEKPTQDWIDKVAVVTIGQETVIDFAFEPGIIPPIVIPTDVQSLTLIAGVSIAALGLIWQVAKRK